MLGAIRANGFATSTLTWLAGGSLLSGAFGHSGEFDNDFIKPMDPFLEGEQKLKLAANRSTRSG
jgi:hypothetical protein